MIGMYISFFLANQFGIDPLLSLFVSMPVLFVVGVLIQHFLIRRVLGPNDMPQIFLTFALSLLLLNLALMLFTANYRTVHTSYSDEAFHIAGPLHSGRKTDRLCRRDVAERRALGVPAHHRPRQGDARRGAEPRRGDADGHQPQPRVLRRAWHRAGAGGRRRLALDAVLFGLSVRRPGLRADGLRRRGHGHARQCDRRADRQPVDGGRGIAGHSICRRRLRIDRRVRHAAADARLQTDRPWGGKAR